MSKTAEKYKEYYETGKWNKTMLANMVSKGKITQEEYEEIIADTEND